MKQKYKQCPHCKNPMRRDGSFSVKLRRFIDKDFTSIFWICKMCGKKLKEIKDDKEM